MRRIAAALLLVTACGDDAPAIAGTTGSEGSSTGALESSTGSTSSSSSASSSTTEAASESGDGPMQPPRDEDFEWDAVQPVDCGDRGHVVLDSGPPANRVNFVILGDGYTAEEIDGTYVDHVDAMLYAMFGPDGFPYDVYTSSFNICRIDVVSNESGTDFPAQGIEVDTAMNGRGDVASRLAYVDPTLLQAELDDALASANIDPDWVAVTLNTELWVGAGGYPMLWSGGHDTPEIGVHEAGHSFHALADEYSEGNGTYMGGEPGEINVTADMSSDKWAVWLGFDQDDVGEIGFYEGARYYDFGMWRPSFEGRMRTVTRSHNAPSVDKMIRDFYTIAGPVDDVSPKVENEYPPALGLRVIDEALVHVDWEVDDEVVLVDAGPRIWTEDLELSPGAHQVTAVVRDLTEWVRAADRSVLEMRVTWPLQVPAERVHTTALGRSAGRPERAGLRLRAPVRQGTRASEGGRPHGLGAERVRSMQANAELLRARDEISAGRAGVARERLRRHAAAFGQAGARDRSVLAAAIACLEGGAAPVAAHGRFAKVLRRACE